MVAVGQSWGGNVVVELAARFPHQVAAVAVIDGGFLRLADDFPRPMLRMLERVLVELAAATRSQLGHIVSSAPRDDG